MTKLLISSDELVNYPSIVLYSGERKTTKFYNDEYYYYGHVVKNDGTAWKVGQIFKLIASIFLIGLTGGLIWSSEKFRNTFSHRVKCIKNSCEKVKIYMLHLGDDISTKLESLKKDFTEQNIINFFKSLRAEKFSKEKLIEICKNLLNTYFSVQNPSKKILEIIFRNIYNRFQGTEDRKMIREALYMQCQTHKQWLDVDEYSTLLLESGLPHIHAKGWMNDFAKDASLITIGFHLVTCDDPKIYFALKKALILQKRYDEVLSYLEIEEQNRMENVTENGFQQPAPKQ